MDETSPFDAAPTLNAMLADQPGWAGAMGIAYVRVTADEMVAEMEIDGRHLQPYGIVHGGVHAGAVETVASVGAAMVALPRGQVVVGLDNHTTFVRAARSGRVRISAVAITRGRTSQVWEATVKDEQGRLLATGRVRLLCVAEGATLAGEGASVGRMGAG